ncbi:tetratricopeptide repeat-containing sensor histidine kinase [Pedobacter alpinus]|uniref:Oxygen sensor histidine kinase NreB n=1 Tax=Pedobacter alpinus TaxID=1590643 RepID=A0ABW5TQ71_9SPHI
MLKFILSLYFSFITITSFAQEINYKKQVQNVISSKLNDEQKVDSLFSIAIKFYKKEPDVSLKIADQFYEIAESNKYSNGLGSFWYLKSRIEERQGNINIAKDFNYKAIGLLKDSTKLSAAYSFQSWIFRRLSLKEKSIEYGIKGVEIAEALNNYNLIYNAYNNIAALYVGERDYVLARKYHLLCSKYAKLSGNKSKIAANLGNLGIVSLREKKYDEAIAYHKQSLKVFKELKDSSEIAFVYNDLGATYSQKGDQVNGIKYLRESIRLREKMKESNELAYTYNYLGEAYNYAGNFKEAEKWIKKALAFAVEINNTKQNFEALESVSNFYASNKKLDSAYKYLNLYKTFGDSLRKIDNALAINELTTRFETEKKDQEIKLLSKDKELQKAEIKNKNYLLLFIGFIAIAIISIGLFIIYKRKANEKLNLQKEIIKQQDLATKAVLEAEEKERRRISGDLHDGVGQMLSASLLNLNHFIASVKDKLSASEEEKAKTTISLVTESYDEMRSVSHQMMPNALLKSGLSTAIREFLNKIESDDLKINLSINGLNQRLDEQTETVMYRIVQECVNNIIKHANANQITIQINKDAEAISCTIEDNGLGFDKTISVKGVGLSNIESRISFLKGEVEIDSALGKGTLVSIYIPLNSD